MANPYPIILGDKALSRRLEEEKKMNESEYGRTSLDKNKPDPGEYVILRTGLNFGQHKRSGRKREEKVKLEGGRIGA